MMRLSLCVMALAVWELACSGTEEPPTGPGKGVPSFNIVVEPTTLNLFQEGTAEVTVRVSHSGAPQPVVLSLADPPVGLMAPTVAVSETEDVGVLHLAATRELEVRGHLVDLVASGASGTRVRRLTVNVQSSRGSLAVTIGSPLLLVSPTVRIQGPGGFEKAVSSTQVISDLVPGEYQITPSPLFRNGQYVQEAYDGTVQGGGRVAVQAAAQTPVQVSYAQRKGSGNMWLLDTTANVLIAWNDGDLGGRATDTSIGLESSATAGALAFDAAGNLWVTLRGANAIARYDAAQLETSGNKAPAAVLEGIDTPEGLGFDAAGNLWTASGDAVWKLAAADLPASGRRMATPVLRLRGGMTAPRLTAFDKAGNLYVLSQGDGRLVRFAVAQLAATGEVTTTPDARIRSTGALASPTGFAFNSEGDLIIANEGSSAFLARFRAAQLQVTGEVDLEPHLRLFSSSLVSPSAVAFDLQGGIWVADAGSARVNRFSQAQLTGSGDVSVSPQTNVYGESGPSSSQRFSALAFSAPPAGVPLLR